jgi:hypothetical protein
MRPLKAHVVVGSEQDGDKVAEQGGVSLVTGGRPPSSVTSSLDFFKKLPQPCTAAGSSLHPVNLGSHHEVADGLGAA